MDKNLNLVEILKDAPKGTKLWSPICGECELVAVEENYAYPISCNTSDGINIKFTNLGKYYSIFKNGECVLFPSKENRDWSTFNVSERGHKHFVPFQRVLCAFDHDYGYEIWAADVYSHYDESTGKHYLVSGFVVNDNEVIPYEGNEDKLGKSVK